MEHANWVTERAKCNMRDLLQDLAHLVEHDTKLMQEESKARNMNFAFLYVPYGHLIPSSKEGAGPLPAKCAVERMTLFPHRSKSRCKFEYVQEVDHIAVTIGRVSDVNDQFEHTDRVFTIRTAWEPENVRCLLKITLNGSEEPPTEFPHDELKAAVQYILEPFFFPAPGKEGRTATEDGRVAR